LSRSLPSPSDDRKLFLLAGDRLRRALACAGIGVGALTADRQALAVTQAAIAAQVHQTLHVHWNFATKITFHPIALVDHFANTDYIRIRQLIDTPFSRNTDLLAD